MLLLGIALWRSRAVPRWAAALASTLEGHQLPIHQVPTASVNSAVRAMLIMYVRCESALGHIRNSLTCGYLSPGIGQVDNVAGHSHGGSSPSRTHAYVHADGPRTWLDLPCPALHLIDSYGLISTCQEHDIPARIPASAPVGADHEPDNALARHSYQSMSSPRINLSPGRPAREPGRRRSRAVAESSVRERPPAPDRVQISPVRRGCQHHRAEPCDFCCGWWRLGLVRDRSTSAVTGLPCAVIVMGT